MTTSVHQFECRVYFEDTDAGGVVYNANYLKFYERARTELLRSLGYEQDVLLQQNIVFVVRHIDIDFIRAARFNDLLRIDTRIGQLKKVSLEFTQQAYSTLNFNDQAGQNKPVNQARVKVVCVSADTFKPTAIPADIYRTLSQYE